MPSAAATTAVNKAKAKLSKTRTLARSLLDVRDVPISLIDPSPENPQEMDDATFDELVEGIRRDGMDEPIHITPILRKGKPTGRYMTVSGHHRVKGAKAAGLKKVPAIIKQMDDIKRKTELVRRNNLRGAPNSKKFTALFKEVAPQLGQERAKQLMGFTKKGAFEKIFESVAKKLPPAHRKALEEAKEDVKSVDDLSSILHGIFKKEGSKAQKGYMVFSFAGKKHFYYQVDKKLTGILQEINNRIDSSGRTAAEVFAELLDSQITVEPKKKVKKRVRIKKD